MATTFKSLGSGDVTTTRTLLHESIPITGSIVSGTYGGSTIALGSEPHIKTYSHGMFQSVYDYPYLSSSANHIFDITVGYANDSALSASSNSQNAKKINVYNQMAQVLMGYDETGSVRQFDQDGDIIAGGTKLKECVFFNFSRLLYKDEIKKGSFELELGVSGAYTTPGSTEFLSRVKLTDYSGSAGYFVNSPAGEYGVLFVTASSPYTSPGVMANNQYEKAGLLFYQAGVAVVTASVFTTAENVAEAMGGAATGGGILSHSNRNPQMTTQSGSNMNTILTGSTIDTIADAVRHRTWNMSFNNTTELNSTIYFCRANNTDFNYSSNPTYLSTSNGPSEIVVKDADALNDPLTYITTVGLYSPDNELLAVAKLSEPLKKDPSNELTLRVRLDY